MNPSLATMLPMTLSSPVLPQPQAALGSEEKTSDQDPEGHEDMIALKYLGLGPEQSPGRVGEPKKKARETAKKTGAPVWEGSLMDRPSAPPT